MDDEGVMDTLVILLILIWQSLQACAPGLTDLAYKLQANGLIHNNTRKSMVYMTLRACRDKDYREREWVPYYTWNSRQIPNRELEREWAAVREQAYKNMRSKEQ